MKSAHWFFVAMLAWGATAQAGNLADLSIVSRDDQRPLETYHHRGKTYVVGEPGMYYQVRISNRSGRRLLAVLSVDGVNAVSGETAAPEQGGYVLEPWASTEISGWRKSSAEVAGFYFTRLPDSYAARTDRPANVGVIGVALFREYQDSRPPPISPEPYRDRQGARPSAPYQSETARPYGETPPSAAAAEAEGYSRPESADKGQSFRRESKESSRLGTGHGEREYAPISYTNFRRASSNPDEVISLYYDSYSNLRAAGVIPRRSHYPRPHEPQPFPGGFVPDPPPRW